MLERIKSIFYRPEFFRSQSFGLGQALGFYSLTIFVFVGLILVTLLPSVFTLVQSMRSGEWQVQRGIVAALYPADLTVTVDRNTVSTNRSEPVVIPFPEAWSALAECGPRRCVQNELPANLLVIDTTRPINQSDFAARDTIAILGAEAVGFHNPERGETRIINLKEAGFRESFTLTAPMFHKVVEKGFKALQIGAILLLFIVPVILYVGLWIGHLVYSLFGALVVWLAANIRGYKIAYGQAYRSTLYLLVAPLLVTLLLSTVTSSRVPFVCTLILFGMALLNFPKVEKLPDPVKIAAADTLVAAKAEDSKIAKPMDKN